VARVNLAQMEGPLETTGPIALPRAWYGASLAEFLSAEPGGILGRLAANSGFAGVPEQKDAWLYQLGFGSLESWDSGSRLRPAQAGRDPPTRVMPWRRD
jgi:hypothetical protein